jgi:hypothetical protein
MPEERHRFDLRPSAAAGHLSVHFDDQHPQNVPFLFEPRRDRYSSAFGLAFVVHLLGPILLILLVTYTPKTQAIDNGPVPLNEHIVWIAEPGPGGGGGGGGNRSKEPPRKAELPGKDKITVPVLRPPTLQPPKLDEKPPETPQPQQ